MKTLNPSPPVGYSPLAPGKIANVVTYLEMTERPRRRPVVFRDRHVELRPLVGPDLAGYRAIYRRVGEDWLWSSRIAMADEELSAILASPQVEVSILHREAQPIGLLELDFREQGECELAFFGLVRDAIGQGAGRFLMDQAITRAWARPIRRFWVHTCTHDHPAAVDFYRRSGFHAYAYGIEVLDDPRLAGDLPRTAAPNVPLIEP
jgi:GNAT superfamily N-acetyltransferase